MSIEKITKDHELSQSENIVESNIDKLKALFPEIVTEGKIDFKVLQEVLGNELEEGEEYYRFTWAGKSNARREAQKPSTGTLRPAPEESVDWDTTENLYIEGDNLEVLKLLQKGYAGKVKMIYIDPPYNTGKDFVYKDNYKDNLRNYQEVTGQLDEEGNKISTNSDSDGRYHSNWLNMMYPRLRLARNLLKEDGVIFMSIDDNEVENLKKIGNEIFGEENFQGYVSRATGTPTGGGNAALVNKVDYLLVFSKSGKTEILGLPLTESEQKIYDKKDEFGKYLIRPLRRTGGEDRREDRPSMYYAIKAPDNTDVFPIAPAGYESRWICGKEKAIELEKNNLLEWKNGDDGWVLYQKFYLEGRLKQPSNLWDDVEGNKKATRQVKKLFGDKKVFDFPKPVGLIERMIQMINFENNDIVLDFFSGSGSTAHAIMQVNTSDNVNRKHIQVQLPEATEDKTIASKAGYKTIAEIGKERIRRAAKKIAEEHPEKAKDLDLGFKVFKLDTSNIKGWDGNPDNLDDSLFDAQDNIKTDRTEHDVLYEILLKYGLDLTLPIEEKVIAGKTVFSVGYGALFICLANTITSKVAEGIGEWKEELQPEVCRVVFKDSGFSDVEKTNSVQTLKRFGITEIKSI